MKQGFRQSMAWLHTWGGLVFTWLLFAIFLAGTLSFFREEISLWMQPELHRVAPEGGDGVAYALAELQQRGAGAKSWTISLPGPRDPVVEARWNKGKFDPKALVTLDPATGEVLAPRETRGGTFFRSFHFSLMQGVLGEWIVGIATMMMLVALITGIVIHKKIFKDFFTFRPEKSKPRAWLDAHNVTGVMALPFHLMITYTGLVTLMYVYMPAGIAVVYGSEEKSFFATLSSRQEAPQPQGTPAELTALEPLLAQARAHWNGAPPGSVLISNPGDAAVVVDIMRRRGASIAARIEPMLRFDGVTGRLLAEHDDDFAARNTYGVMYGLHVAWFAQPFLRGLLFAMGLMGCLMIASGAVIWTAKRREQHTAAYAAPGYRLVEALNVAGVAGLLLSFTVYFWANRLLPTDLPERIGWEQRCLFITWLLTLGYALLRGNFAKTWRELLWLAALLLFLIPLLNAASGGLPLWESMAQQRWPLAGFDLLSMAIASALAWAGWSIARPRQQRAPRRRVARPSTGVAVETSS